ncbi:hypothetical protein KR222_006081 [Zaprionus bogoriensis]|nr:hypothetical protein KR222_006081 [Zaprionus bogoriensis]
MHSTGKYCNKIYCHLGNKMSELGIFVCLLWLCMHANGVLSDIIKVDPNIIEDAHLTTPGLLRKYGYKVEEHKINTKDGFQLTAHRIPKPGAQPVLLVHGLADSSATWILKGPCCGLGYLLSERGYDVWMLNVRGNRYSRKHRKYQPVMRQFWDFSFHEIGIYDVPASIDYVLARSKGHKQVHYVGHSQGTTAFFAMGADKPEYMKKVKLFQALAPTVYFNHLSPASMLIKPYATTFVNLLKVLGIYEFPPERDVWRRLAYQICTFAFRNTCIYIIMVIMGFDRAQLNSDSVPLLLGHYPSGSSSKSFAHYFQIALGGRFNKFDYDSPWENKRRYGTIKAPDYNLDNVDCKVALYYGRNDHLSMVQDVLHLRRELPNVVHDELLAYKYFNHMDFVIAINATELLYKSMFRVMKKVDRGEL